MKFLLLYYTGTYNTRYLTKQLKDKLINQGHEVETLEVDISSPLICLEHFDYVGLGYPIYAFNAPKIFIDYLKRLDFNQKATYFIYKNSGETLRFNDASSREIKTLLKKRKLHLLNEKHFLMPYNIHFRFDDNCVKEILSYDQKLIDILIYELENHINSLIKSNLFYNLTSRLFLIQRSGAYLNHFFYKVDRQKCINCGLCVKSCPTQNIEIDKEGKLTFNRNCIMCMRCSFFCPTDAINIGMLEGWKVNGAYNFQKIQNDQSLDGHFIKEDQKGFFKCYKKTYQMIDDLYAKYFSRP